MMKTNKLPTFVYTIYEVERVVITETRTGITGTVIKNDNGYSVQLNEPHNLSESKKHALQKRMRNWYYYNYIKGSTIPL